MNEASPLNQSSRSLDCVDPRTLVSVAAGLCQLPAVPTQDWAVRAAEALSGVDPDCRVAVLITRVGEQGQLGPAEALAVRSVTSLGDSGIERDDSSTRGRIERLPDLGLTLPSDAVHRGLSADAADLGEWRTTLLGRAWETRASEQLLLGIAPIQRVPQVRDEETPDPRCVITMISLASTEERRARLDPRALGALLTVLCERARLAMSSGEDIRWLTDREQEVLDRLTLGSSVREIAEAFGRSPHTVHDHVKSLHRKLSASSRGELVARALGHTGRAGQALNPVVIQRARAATQIEAMPSLARRSPSV